MSYGTVQAEQMTTQSGFTLGAGNASSLKNRIFNGGMVIDQRLSGASNSTSAVNNTYTLDRWQAAYSASSKFSVQQNAGSVTPPVGFINYLGCVSSAATTVGTSDYYILSQAIEGLNSADLAWGTANAKTITLSFYVYSSLTGTFGGAINNSAFNRGYPFTYSIPTANTWTQISVTIAGDTTGTWLTTNGIGVYVFFSLGAGASASGAAGAWAASGFRSATGAVQVVATNAATFNITGVQLEVGTVATSFDFRSIGTELSLCQRYYFALNAANVGSNGSYFVGVNRGTSLQGHISPPQPMRTAPSLTSSGTTTFYVQNGSSNLNCTTAATIASSTGGNQTIFLVSGTYSAYTAGYAGQMIDQSGSSFLNFSAEL